MSLVSYSFYIEIGYGDDIMTLPKKYVILGLDLSLSSTGWSVVTVDGENYKLVDYGYIPTDKLDHYDALLAIDKKLQSVIEKYKPDYSAIEQMFVGKNRDTAIKLGHIHGVATLLLAKNKIPSCRYAVMTLKSKVTGGIKTKKEDGTKKTGNEMKEEVKRKIVEIFGVNSFIKEFNSDVTDSISAAYTFILMDGKEIEKKKAPRKKKTT
ncbi:gp349 [Bacillus phage G]|uniref:Gp349 n=1 Tax=Bacillus phage G TaxID=2884420 RepID=G3MA90_9CAUD|nr:gp349 [Bacillus phage G]AEO93608.1 gp349 [Bacillus phage G]